MSFLRHILIALGYSIISAAVALMLPRFFSGIDPNTSIMLGAVVLVGSALLHEVFARQEEEGRLVEEVQDLRAGHGQVMGELTRAREEVGQIYKAIETMTGRGSGGKALQEDVGKVMAEVRMLQGLVENLTNAADPSSPPDEVTSLAQIVEASDEPVLPIDPEVVPAGPVLDDATIVHLVRDGIAKDRVDLVLQPVVSLPQRKRKFCEAYTRIRSEDGEVITPTQYIAIAEREGLVTAIDNLMLFRCVQQLRNKHNKNRNIGFFCNISPHTLADKKFFNDFIVFMTENSSLAQDLIFEFSHATIANQDDEIRHQLSRLAALGFRFSLDQVNSLNLDYGALAEQHFKYIKIDAQTMLREVPQPTTEIDLHDFKKALERQGIDLIVEKIETEDVLRDILDFHVDFGQGYLFGEPKSLNAA
ncbi:MAG: cyclic-di-GMP phosphodiesterase TipF (flagellum assembly factor) [Paracoccaceae bacterium]|jgi:cyclic-di-GMP phosphodiesterase TipF (flagellum assembly factor)